VVFFIFIFLMFQALRLAEFFIVHGVGAGILLEMTSLLAVSFLPLALPVAFLIGVLIAFGRLSSDSELVAMKANGISLRRLSAPVTVVAVLVTVVSLGLNLDWVPHSDASFRNLLARVSSTKIVSSIKEGTFTSGFFDLLIYADHVDRTTSKMQGVFIYDEREAKNPMTIIAREGEILPVRKDSLLGAAAVLKLFNGNIHRNDSENGAYQKIDFMEYRLFLKVDEGSGASSLKPRMIRFERLMHQIRNIEPSSPWRHELMAELSRRLALAMSPVVFVFLGIGFGTVRTRAVRSGAMLVAIVVVLFYYGVQALGTVAVQKGWMNPLLAMQLPNIISALVAWRAFRAASW